MNDAISASQYPTLSERVQSTFIDTIVIILLMFLCATVLERYEGVHEYVRIFFFIAIWIGYEPICTTLGCTIGNYAKDIRVRKVADENKRLNLLQALIRYCVKLLLGWFSFLTMHVSTRKQAIHDVVVGSVVIRKARTLKEM